MPYNRLSKKSFYVYFARAGGMMKIGCSSQPIERMKQIGEWVPFQIELAATIPGAFDLEADLHAHFCDQWSHLEWFHNCPDMEAMVSAINAGEPLVIPRKPRDHPKEMFKTLKKRASRRVTIAEKRAGIEGWYSLRPRPQYLLDALDSFEGSHNPPPSSAALAAIARYEDELADQQKAA